MIFSIFDVEKISYQLAFTQSNLYYLIKNHLICNPEHFANINHNGLIYLSVLYHELDIIDNLLNTKEENYITDMEHLLSIMYPISRAGFNQN